MLVGASEVVLLGVNVPAGGVTGLGSGLGLTSTLRLVFNAAVKLLIYR